MKSGGYQNWPVGGGVQPSPGSGVFAGSSGIPPGGVMPFGNITTPAAIANVGVETSFGISAPILPAVLALNGSVLIFECSGLYSTTLTPTMVFRARLDVALTGDIIAQSPTITAANNAANNPWFWRGGFEARNVATGNCTTLASYWMGATGVGAGVAATSISQGGTVLSESLSSSHTVFISVLWGAASPSNTISMNGFQVYAFQPAASA